MIFRPNKPEKKKKCHHNSLRAIVRQLNIDGKRFKSSKSVESGVYEKKSVELLEFYWIDYTVVRST